ncbi:MAG: conjugal transfer protein TraF [Smithella sp.]
MKNNNIFIIIIMFMMLVPYASSAIAADGKSFFTRKDEGWFFYKKKPVPPKEQKKSETRIETKEDTKTEAEKIREHGEKLLGQAMVRPTEENVKAYMEYQRRMMDGANRFAKVWERVLAKNPDLYLAEHYSEDVVGDMKKEIRQLASKTGIFFFFSSGCQYCHQQADVILTLKHKYGFKVLAISLDGGDMPQLRGMTIADNGISINLNISTVPAIYLAYPEENRFEAISQGYLPFNDIERRLYHYAQMESGNEPVGLSDINNSYSY